MPYVITEACIGTKDKSCVDVCPVDCIYEGPEMLYIHPDECIDCGACEPECPGDGDLPGGRRAAESGAVRPDQPRHLQGPQPADAPDALAVATGDVVTRRGD